LHDQQSWATENTPEALADAIEKSIKTDLARSGREAAGLAQERHAWRRVFAQLFCIYRDVCAKYRGS
jgi:hypothetical protein